MTRNRAQHASLVEEPVPVFFSEPASEIQQWQELRYDYSIVEDINRVNESVMLYGLTR